MTFSLLHPVERSARIRRGVWVTIGLLLLAVAGPLCASEAKKELDFAAAQKLLENSCGDCHGGSEGEGGFSLEQIAAESGLREKYDEWMKLRRRVADHSMPPDDVEPMDDASRTQLIAWIRRATREAVGQQGETAGPPLFRRMAAHEYSNTIRDLLGIHFDAGNGLPQDPAGGEGFNNASETLIISPIHAEKYVEAATAALDYA
ncbi:MAG: DUF1587 domain-containing protein, partial [Blastopirellula sp. JB062]